MDINQATWYGLFSILGIALLIIFRKKLFPSESPKKNEETWEEVNDEIEFFIEHKLFQKNRIEQLKYLLERETESWNKYEETSSGEDVDQHLDNQEILQEYISKKDQNIKL